MTTKHAGQGPVERGVGRLVPERVQLSRAKGWRMPPNTVKVDRSTRWGNPFKLHGDGRPMISTVAAALFNRHFEDGHNAWVMRGQLTTLADVRRELRGKRLACWCSLSEPCHADVLLRLANSEPPGLPTRLGCRPCLEACAAVLQLQPRRPTWHTHRSHQDRLHPGGPKP